jgi:integrase
MDTNKALTTQRAARAHKYVSQSKAEATRRAYETHWKDFQSHCAQYGYEVLPARWEAVVDFITLLADLGAKLSTIQVKTAAITYYHRMAGLPSPMLSPQVKETMSGIRRTIGSAQKGKAPLTLSEIKALLDVLPDDVRGIRDRAIILVGFGGAFRRSELVALNVSDVKFRDNDAVITVLRSKTDQEGIGMQKYLPVLQNKTLCPVTALKAWLRAAGITSGPLFRPIARHGNIPERHMNPQEIARLVKKYVALAGLDATVFSGHSFRAGYVTEAADHDVDLWKIKQQTGHKSNAVLERYIRNQGRGARASTRTAFGETE